MNLANLEHTVNYDTLALIERYGYGEGLTNYYPEDLDYRENYIDLKYSHSVVIDVMLLCRTSGPVTLSTTVLSRTSECQDSVIELGLTEDGYIRDYHMVFPTEDWVFDPIIYSLIEGKKFWYYNTLTQLLVRFDNGLTYYNLNELDYEQIDPSEFETLPIDFDVLHLFVTNRLRDCYVKTSYAALAENLGCKENADLKRKRDLIHMVYHIIQYLVDFKNFAEAQLLYEEFTKCGGLCADFVKPSKHYGCGCR